MRIVRKATLPCLMALAWSTGFAQQPSSGDTARIVRIIRADRLTIVRTDSRGESYILAGNVELLQADTRFFCDSAVKDESRNIVEAFGNIHINDSDSVHTYAQQLTYLGDSRMATLRRKVRLTNVKGVLTTDELQYDVVLRTGTYEKGGRLVNGNSVLTSREGRYNADTREAYFIKDVRLKDSEYTMTTDTLLYDAEHEKATFVSATTIRDGRTVIRTRSGYYELRTGNAQFGKRPVIEDSSQFVTAEDIRYDKKSGAGVAEGNVVYRDTSQGVLFLAGRTEFSNADGRLLASRRPVMVLRQDDDSLFIAADTLFSIRLPAYDSMARPFPDSTSRQGPGNPPVPGLAMDSMAGKADTDASLRNRSEAKVVVPVTPAQVGNAKLSADTTISAIDSVRLFRAFHRVRIYSDSMQAICDSLSYSTSDSVFKLFKDPILWARGSQVTGDTMHLLTHHQKPKEFVVLERGFSVSRTPEDLFNQIRGNQLNGYFSDGSIERLRSKGNAESLYYLQDEDSAYFGLNHAKADAITLYFMERELKRITWVNGVEGVTYPFRQIPADKRELPGFTWREDRRPKSRLELFQD